MEPVIVVVMEQGAVWPGWIADCRATPESLVIAQQAEETPAELALRVVQRLALLEAGGHGVVTAVLAAGHAGGDEVYAARCVIARTMLAHMAGRSRAGGLVFAASEEIDEGRRVELLELAETLIGQLAGTRLSIGLHFGSPERTESALWACQESEQASASAA